MNLRPYQSEAVTRTIAAWESFDRVLGIAPTGGGKTIIFSAITQRCQDQGRTLILAHREELIDQAIQKLWTSTGIAADKEKAEFRARMSSSVVVGSVQTLLSRHARFPADHFARIITDECHHVLADSYQKTLSYFGRSSDNPSGAKILGVTATADRTDKRNLGEYFQEVAFEVNLLDLIKQGYLSKIVAKTVPLKIDISAVKKTAGDFDAGQVGEALAPMLGAVVAAIKEHAANRKIIVFLPLCATSREFVKLCEEAGLKARHVDGESVDRKEILSAFSRNEFQILANSMLLTEGYDEPSVDCVIVLRPTQSRSLYCQMVGRGTRIHPGKENLLILDFLWNTAKHSLIKPAHLIARDGEEAKAISEFIEKDILISGGEQMEFGGEEFDLEDAMTEVRAQREASLRRQLEKQAKKQSRLIDPIEYGLDTHELTIAEFEPTMHWHSNPVTKGQRNALESFGLDPETLKNAGHASVLLDAIFARKAMGLASPKQVLWLRKTGHPSPATASKVEAATWLDAKFKKKAANN